MILFLLFIVLPIAELFVIVQVSGQVSFASTLGLMILSALVGSALMRHQGLRTWRRFNEQIAQGRVPTREIADGVCIIAAGALMITPGFITDIAGLLLLFPPTRLLVRNVVVRRATAASKSGRVRVIRADYDRGGSVWVEGGSIHDTTGTEVRGKIDDGQ